MVVKSNVPHYDVKGLIIDVGYVPTKARITKIVNQLKKDVPEFAALVSPALAAELLGKGATDIFVPIRQGKKATIQNAWAAVHALMAHDLVADCEPAVKIEAEPPDAGSKAFRSNVGSTHLPSSELPDWSIKQAQIDIARGAFNVTGKGVKIGHPDTGYTKHPEIFSPRLLVEEGYDFEDRKADPLDPLKKSGLGHGAATASVIMSGTSNVPRVFGVAPDAKLVPLRVSDSVIHFDFSNVVQALYRARDKKCHVVSMSLGGPWAGRSLGRAVDQVIGDGLILLAAAGNKWPWVVYPALFDNVVAVAACNADVKLWKGSASGPAVDVTAPGESVWRARTNKSGADKFPVERSSGTSYAVATTAGVCALWLEHHGVAALQAKYGGRLAAVFLSLLKASCKPVAGWNTLAYGPGILDANKLLSLPLPALGAAPRKVGTTGLLRASGVHAVDRLQMYFPELSSKQLAKATTAFLGDRSKGHARIKAIASPSLIDEVEFYVATQPEVRAAFLVASGKAGMKKAGPAGAKHAVTSPVQVLEHVASEPLRRLIAT